MGTWSLIFILYSTVYNPDQLRFVEVSNFKYESHCQSALDKIKRSGYVTAASCVFKG